MSTSIAPAFWRMARQPRWIGVLALALGVAAGFAALGQWQLSRSVENAFVEEVATETTVPLEQLTEPRRPMLDAEQGRMVEVSGEFDPASWVVLTGRDNNGPDGAWLVGRLRTEDGASLAVAVGWAPDAEGAAAAADAAQALGPDIRGRYMVSEGPQESDFEAGERSALAVPELVNEWSGFDGQVYAGYVVVDAAPAGLEEIFAPPPDRQVTLNWLNVFYAIEWVLFAGFAIYLWYRLLRDAVEQELEEQEAQIAPAGGS